MTTFASSMSPGTPGMLAYSGARVQAFSSQEGSLLQPGQAVSFTDIEEVGPPTSGSLVAGVVMRSHLGGASSGFSGPVSVCRAGVIWVSVANDVSPGQPVFASAERQGELGASGDIQIHSAVWRSSAQAGDLAMLELNLP